MIGQSGGLEPTRDSNPVGLEEHLCPTVRHAPWLTTPSTPVLAASTTSFVRMVKNIHV